MKHASGLLLVLGCVLVTGCGDSEHASSNASPSVSVTSDDFGVRSDFKSQSTDQTSEDCTVQKGIPCRRVTITVPLGLSKDQLDQNLRKATEDAFNAYHAVRGIVFAMADGQDMNDGYTAGRIQFGKEDFSDTADETSTDVGATIRVDFMPDYFKPVSDVDKTVAKIPIKTRQEIYYDEGAAEDRGTHEADAKIPITSGMSNLKDADLRNWRLSQDLAAKYRKQLEKRNHITDDQLDKIDVEGMLKHWPTPDSESD